MAAATLASLTGLAAPKLNALGAILARYLIGLLPLSWPRGRKRRLSATLEVGARSVTEAVFLLNQLLTVVSPRDEEIIVVVDIDQFIGEFVIRHNEIWELLKTSRIICPRCDDVGRIRVVPPVCQANHFTVRGFLQLSPGH